MKNFPDHPDIARALRTGYPYPEERFDEETEESWYDDLSHARREEELFGEPN